jgi:HlyD family secretion protein
VKPLTRTILLLAGGSAIGLAAWAFWPKAVVVEIAKVTQGTFVATIDEDCQTRIRDRYVVSAPVSGHILRVAAEAGDVVREGDALATIMPSSSPLLDARARAEQEEQIGASEAAVVAAEAEVDRLRAQLAQAQAEAARVDVLAERGVASKEEKERRDLATVSADREVRAAEMRRHVAEHQLEAARATLTAAEKSGPDDQIVIVAPITGTVLTVVQVSAAPVATGAPILDLGDPAKLEVVCEVLTTDVVRVTPGSPVQIDRWGGPAVLAGRVVKIEPAGFTKVSALGVEEQRVRALIDITSPHEKWTALGDAFRVDARIETGRTDGAILAPATALFRRGDGWGAFVVNDGIAQERAVTVLGRSGSGAAIAEGLSAGDDVVVFPPGNLKDGGRVRVQGSS